MALNAVTAKGFDTAEFKSLRGVSGYLHGTRVGALSLDELPRIALPVAVTIGGIN